MKMVERKIVVRTNTTDMSDDELEELTNSICDEVDIALNVLRVHLPKDIILYVDSGFGEVVWKG